MRCQGRLNLREVGRKGVALVLRAGRSSAWYRAQIDPRAGRGGWTPPGRRAAAAPPPGRGPAVCGRRRSDWDRPTAPMPVWATCSAAADRSCTERSWRPATGRMSTGQSRGDDSRPCALLKLDWAERRDPDRRAGQDAVRGQTRRADWTAASPWWMWSAATTTSTTTAAAQITTSATTAAVIFHRLVRRRRPVAAGPLGARRGRLGARFPGLAALHRWERTAGSPVHSRRIGGVFA